MFLHVRFMGLLHPLSFLEFSNLCLLCPHMSQMDRSVVSFGALGICTYRHCTCIVITFWKRMDGQTGNFIYDCVDLWISSGYFYLLHVNMPYQQKNNKVVDLELWVVATLSLISWQKWSLVEAWIQFLLSFLVNLFAAIVFVLVINHMAGGWEFTCFCFFLSERFFCGGIPGYHYGIIDFAEENSNVTKSSATWKKSIIRLDIDIMLVPRSLVHRFIRYWFRYRCM